MPTISILKTGDSNEHLLVAIVTFTAEVISGAAEHKMFQDFFNPICLLHYMLINLLINDNLVTGTSLTSLNGAFLPCHVGFSKKQGHKKTNRKHKEIVAKIIVSTIRICYRISESRQQH